MAVKDREEEDEDGGTEKEDDSFKLAVEWDEVEGRR